MSSMRFVLAVAVSAAVILSAPFIRDIRDWVRGQFPGHFVLVVGSAVALAIATAIIFALVRIRDRRRVRYGAIAAALILGGSYSVWNAQGIAEVDAVEQFHFVEYGLITLLFYRAARPLGDASVFVLPVFAGLVVGTLEEWLQWYIPGRIGDMRDVFLNGVAILCGLLFSVGVDPPERTSLFRAGSVRRLGLAAVVTILVFTAFVHTVHLGVEIADPEAGRFRSRYDAAFLSAIGHERLTEWKANPPITRPERLTREDQYMSEGLLHVQLRNRQWTAGNFAAAWHENLILEKYYAPVLDTPSYVSKTGHRWPDAQRADAQQRAAQESPDGARGYESMADAGEGHHFLRLWSPVALWSVAALAIVIVLLVTFNDRRA